MIFALLKSTFKEIFGSRPRVLAMILTIGMLCATQILYLGVPAFVISLPDEYFVVAVAIAAAGMIGNDASSGIMPLLFARPIKRWQYILSRLIAVTLFSCLFMLLLDSISLGIASIHPSSIPDTQTIIISLIEQSFKCLGLSTVIAFFSTLLPSLGDIAFYGALVGVSQSINSLSYYMDKPELKTLSSDIYNFFNPSLNLGQLLYFEHPSSAEWLSYLSQIVMFFVAAIIILNRKEIGYGSD